MIATTLNVDGGQIQFLADGPVVKEHVAQLRHHLGINLLHRILGHITQGRLDARDAFGVDAAGFVGLVEGARDDVGDEARIKEDAIGELQGGREEVREGRKDFEGYKHKKEMEGKEGIC
jgi:hypothetical protein